MPDLKFSSCLHDPTKREVAAQLTRSHVGASVAVVSIRHRVRLLPRAIARLYKAAHMPTMRQQIVLHM